MFNELRRTMHEQCENFHREIILKNVPNRILRSKKYNLTENSTERINRRLE
jgi:hypothetical protein